MLYSFKIDLEILVGSEKDPENELDHVSIICWKHKLLFVRHDTIFSFSFR